MCRHFPQGYIHGCQSRHVSRYLALYAISAKELTSLNMHLCEAGELTTSLGAVCHLSTPTIGLW